MNEEEKNTINGNWNRTPETVGTVPRQLLLPKD